MTEDIAAKAQHPQALAVHVDRSRFGEEGSQRFNSLLLPPDSCYLLRCGEATLERDGVVT